MYHSTKIVATIGPASESQETIRGMIKAGMNIARLNFSHGSHSNHAERFHLIRSESKALDRSITIMQDLQGPKIRTGKLETSEICLVPGQPLTLHTDQIVGNVNQISIDFPGLPASVNPGSRILLADGQMELVVTEVHDKQIKTEVVLGGMLSERKGVNLPGAELRIEGFTEKDERDLRFGLELGIDAVAISFVRTASDVMKVRSTVEKVIGDPNAIPLIAKLERPEALENLDAILEAADGVMVARGDLGVELSPELVPIAQKRIIESANQKERVVITATQMLESMMHNPRPTRAEASDVANAIFDGSDAVMLSGETAVGEYPIIAIEMMDAIIRQAESNMGKWGRWKSAPIKDSQEDVYFVTLAAGDLAQDRNVTAICVFTEGGRTALLMSKARPKVPILAFTPSEKTYHQLPLYWGVTPYKVLKVDTVEGMLKCVEDTILKETPLQEGQEIVLVCGFPVGEMRPPNMAMLHNLGDLEKSPHFGIPY
jgi:pyruvate kinase